MGGDTFIGSRPPKCVWYTRKKMIQMKCYGESDFLRIGWGEIDS